MGFFDFLKITPMDQGSSRNTSFGGVISIDLARRIQEDWSNIEILMRAGGPSQLRQGLITADKLLDAALKGIVAGNTMAERMKNLKGRFDYNFYQKIWDAHKLRNNLVHEVGFEPQHFIVREAVDTIKQTLIRLGVRL